MESINIWLVRVGLVRVGLVISLDQEHGLGMDHIASALATHPMTQVGYALFLPT
jgi:hypothetical protein